MFLFFFFEFSERPFFLFFSDHARQDMIEKFRTFVDDLYKEIDNQNEILNINECFNSLEEFRFSKQNTVVSQQENLIVKEHTNFIELTQTCGNSHLNKLMLVLSTLTEELNDLSKIGIEKFVNKILLYREDYVVESTQQENLVAFDATKMDSNDNVEDEYSAAASIITVLFDLICYLKRCYDVCTNLLLQKHMILLYSAKCKDKNLKQEFREVLPDLSFTLRFVVVLFLSIFLCVKLLFFRFDIAWNVMANLAVTLINLDQIFSQQSGAIKRDIYNYKRSLEMVLKNLPQFNMADQSNNIQTILTIIGEVEHELFDGSIGGIGANTNSIGSEIDYLFFRGLVVSIINTNISENGDIVRNLLLHENMVMYLKQSCIEFDQNYSNFPDDHGLLSIGAFFSIYIHLFWKDSDKKLLKTIVDLLKKTSVPFVHLNGNVSLSLDQLLLRTLPKQLIEKKLFDSFVNQRECLLKVGYIDAQVKTINTAVTFWLVTIEQSFNSGFYSDSGDVDTLKLIFTHVELIKVGVDYVRQLFKLIRNCIAIYFQYNRSLSKTDTVALCKAINTLKGVQRFFTRFKKIIVEVISHYQKYNACSILNILTKCKQKLSNKVATQGYSVENMDYLSSLILAANCFNGPVITSKRYVLAVFCLSYSIPYPDLFSPEDVTKTLSLLRKISYFMNVFARLSYMFNCEFLYFNREIVNVYISHLYESSIKANIQEVQYFFTAIDDAIQMLDSSVSEKKSSKLVSVYIEEMHNLFKIQFLDPLCKDFEDELRFLTHLDLQVGDKNPFRRELKDFNSLLSSEPIKLGGGRRIIWIKSYIENYLNELAYNMTTIALHDWKTYESMLGFAHSKFGLEFASLQLPTQTLEQGLDVLEITRNIQIFVAAYLYNLNNQFFVERSSANKHLNVLTIRHVSNSIQTHGFGIINSTVNFAYQFLRGKLQTLSQFMFEEHIKSRLIQDIRHFRDTIAAEESKGKSSSIRLIKFPFERAEKFAKIVRKLGSFKDGVTYLDKFRQLLTQIGNVLGFVRMLRSGALRCTSEIANFVPDLDDLGQISFEELVREESATFGEQTVDAAKNFDSVLNTVQANFSDATDYFKLLVEVFAPILRDPKHVHLKNFFVILPATTFNYVQYITVCRERLARKNKQDGAAFTDDGFAMGVVYVLKLLDQLNDFDSLQWFGSVDDHVRQSMNRVAELKLPTSQTSAGGDDKLMQTSGLTIRRLETFHREFKLLNFSMTSSRILFKTSN